MPEPIQELPSSVALSRAAARFLGAHPEWAAELASPEPFTRAEMSNALGNALRGPAQDSEEEFKRRLRLLRNRVLLRVMARDLAGRASLDEVCATMTDLAEVEICAALGFLKEERLIVVGMGKLGGRELNVSSDIDLVFVHPDGIDEQPRYERAGRRLIRLLDDATG